MTIYRRKRDANHTAIVRALRDAGRSVLELHMVGAGCPDIVAAWGHAHVAFMEIKNPKGRNRVEKAQVDFAQAWKGPPVVVVRSREEALRATGIGGAMDAHTAEAQRTGEWMP